MNEEDRERIRRSYYVEDQSIHQIARAEGRNRITIRNALSNDAQLFKATRRQKHMPVFGPYKERVELLLQENAKLPRKQRYTAHRIFGIIAAEGYEGSESTIRQYVGRYKQATRAPDVFLRWNMIQGKICSGRLGRSRGHHRRPASKGETVHHAVVLFAPNLRNGVSYPATGKLLLWPCKSL